MLFNSYEFILIFLPITLLLFYGSAKFLGHRTARNFLVLASLAFYSYWDVKNLPILLLSIVANISFGRLLSKRKSKLILWLGIAFNLLYLGYFKYTDFIIMNANSFLHTNIALQKIVLPLGISFFTFTQTAYLVDVYRGETKEYSLGDYLLFVTIFPHLIAGPILYHKDMIPQFSDKERYCFNSKNFAYGIMWFTIGLLKKVILADKLAIYANQVFNATTVISMPEAWLGSIAYTMQLYFDFSGYSEMAIGLGLMLNFELPWNFNYPYRATSIIDFWRRWHMTLSAFLKNYLYIPLGGNCNGHHLRNVMITMLLGGLWHGAGWTFVAWGGLHGLFICINHLWRKTKINLPNWIGWILTFNVVNLAWIFFRAENFDVALKIVRAMFLVDIVSIRLYTIKNIVAMIICFCTSLLIVNLSNVEKINPKIYSFLFALLLIISIVFLNNKSEFLYFQF